MHHNYFCALLNCCKKQPVAKQDVKISPYILWMFRRAWRSTVLMSAEGPGALSLKLLNISLMRSALTIWVSLTRTSFSPFSQHSLLLFNSSTSLSVSWSKSSFSSSLILKVRSILPLNARPTSYFKSKFLPFSSLSVHTFSEVSLPNNPLHLFPEISIIPPCICFVHHAPPLLQVPPPSSLSD